MKHLLEVGKERALGKVLTFRERTNQEIAYRTQIINGDYSEEDENLALKASQEFGTKELTEELSEEIVNFADKKIAVAKVLLGVE